MKNFILYCILFCFLGISTSIFSQNEVKSSEFKKMDVIDLEASNYHPLGIEYTKDLLGNIHANTQIELYRLKLNAIEDVLHNPSKYPKEIDKDRAEKFLIGYKKYFEYKLLEAINE